MILRGTAGLVSASRPLRPRWRDERTENKTNGQGQSRQRMGKVGHRHGQ